MVYAIIGIVVAIALFLIFRNDHDGSYNKNERRGHGAEKSRYEKRTPKAEFKSQPKSQPRTEFKSEPKASNEGHREDVKEKVRGAFETFIKEIKEQAAEPMKDLKGDLRKVLEEAKGAFDKAMQEAGQKSFWTSGTEAEEQVQPEPEGQEMEDDDEVDLSFLNTLDYYEDLEENTETFDITGLRYYCTVHDCGKIVGVVKPDPSNVHDSRAQAVIRSDGKLLGYIPRTQLDWYEDFNEVDVVCPFVGEIELDRSRTSLVAEIKVIIPSSYEYVRDEIEDGLWVHEDG